MDKFYYFAAKFLYFLFFALCTIYIVGIIFQASSALAVGINFSNLPALGFIVVSVAVLLFLWKIFFGRKTPAGVLFLIILLAGYFWMPQNIPVLQKNLAFNDCLEIGTCAEGLEINTGKNKITINEDTCTKNGWEWDNSSKTCNIRRKPRLQRI